MFYVFISHLDSLGGASPVVSVWGSRRARNGKLAIPPSTRTYVEGQSSKFFQVPQTLCQMWRHQEGSLEIFEIGVGFRVRRRHETGQKFCLRDICFDKSFHLNTKNILMRSVRSKRQLFALFCGIKISNFARFRDFWNSVDSFVATLNH